MPDPVPRGACHSQALRSAARSQPRPRPAYARDAFVGPQVGLDVGEHGVDMRVLSLTAPGVQMQPDTQTAVADARAANDFLATIVSEHPGRFQGLAAVPRQDPREAAAELRRAVTELGLCGALVNDHTLGH